MSHEHSLTHPLQRSTHAPHAGNLSNNLLSLPFLLCLFGSSLCCISRQRLLNYWWDVAHLFVGLGADCLQLFSFYASVCVCVTEREREFIKFIGASASHFLSCDCACSKTALHVWNVCETVRLRRRLTHSWIIKVSQTLLDPPERNVCFTANWPLKVLMMLITTLKSTLEDTAQDLCDRAFRSQKGGQQCSDPPRGTGPTALNSNRWINAPVKERVS